ncbi:metallophosphoesterase [Brotaphodocola sp.]|uniref:metallophosphoesterase n=1 Tax=Brotaphodocola sp. TaxID=3073577 RepID=UPI003D7D36E6
MKKRKLWETTSMILITAGILYGVSGCARDAGGDSVSESSRSASESSEHSALDPSESSGAQPSGSSTESSSGGEGGQEENPSGENETDQGQTEQDHNRDADRENRKEEKKRFERDGEWESHLIQGSDIHYFARELTDNGERFLEMVEYGDGKVVTYIDAITDAFLDEVMEYCPDALVLSGDLTLEGEKKSHQELAKKLRKVEDAGIPVLVIPGNHDINNKKAAKYKGAQRMPAEYTTPEEFREIYSEFGYDEALSEDPTSLSYVYELDDETRILMLDTCQYDPVAKVGGAILSDTYDWIEEQLRAAWEDGVMVIPVAHHNLLDESEIYVDDCTIEHGEQLVDLLEEWDAPFFLSGHLHVQHYKRSSDDKGLPEMVTSSLATPGCKYGVLSYCPDGEFYYRTWAVDVEKWAKEHGSQKTDLLNFDEFGDRFLRKVFYNQSQKALEKIPSLTSAQKKQMSEYYAELNDAYYQGTAFKIRERAYKDPAYELWMNDGALTELSEYIEYILKDAKTDYNQLRSDR